MYIWDKKIKSIQWEVVTFEDKTTIEFSEEYIKYLSTEEPITTDELHFNKILKIQADILEVFKDAWATKQEINVCIQWITADLIRHEKNIICDLTGAKDYLDINFREINKLALKIQDKDFTN